MPFARVLVANRGEIALRVFRTCRELGIETVAVVEPGDAASLHARAAGTTVPIASYLDSAEHVRAATESGADAVHPGYGFLAESADFAEAVSAAGLTWIGPPAQALRLGGDKVRAQAAAEAAGVPTLPRGMPEQVGYPLVVKAAAGGGGRGMRVVREPTALGEDLEAASREAAASFGDGTVFCERYLERPRHIEIQVLADSHGHVLTLGQRDCSVQRRHQKVVEETPPAGLSPGLLAGLEQAAIAFSRQIGYVSAGTVEFLVADGAFHFLELNGRIQVEHPVTEEVFGIDLVALQLEIAAGASLARLAPTARGHAVEARLYAEDPRTFLPQAGCIERLVLPGSVRVDAGVEEGDCVGTSYDPLLAKLIAHGTTRGQALDRLASALAQASVEPLTTNLPFLRWLVCHPSFRAAEVSIAFLVDHPPLSAVPLRLPSGAFRGSWRLNGPAPPPRARPDVDAAVHTHDRAGGESEVTAPMPGTVISVTVAEGDRVEARQTLVVLEAMKMETPVVAPFEATVQAVHVNAGDTVAGGALLIELAGS